PRQTAQGEVRARRYRRESGADQGAAAQRRFRRVACPHHLLRLLGPPQWAVKQMNRATADNQSAQSEEEGLEPTKEWVKDLIDEIIAEEFASPDLELVWLDEDTDAAQAEAQLESRVKLGAVTLNEMRDSLGLDPFANAAADRPMVLTPTGYVPIEANADGEGAGARGAADVQKYNADEPRVPRGNPDGGQWTRVAASDDPNDASDAPRFQEHGEGHHWVPEAVLKKFNLRKDTRKVLEDAMSGPLADPTVNWFTREHRIYNDAVEKALREFLVENGLTDDEQMTPEQADVFYRRIRGSNDPVIGGLNRKIIRQRLRYIEYFY